MALSRTILPRPPAPLDYSDRNRYLTDHHQWSVTVANRVEQMSRDAVVDSNTQSTAITALNGLISTGTAGVVISAPAGVAIILEQGTTPKLEVTAAGNLLVANNITAGTIAGTALIASGLVSAGSITSTGLISAGSITATGLISAGSITATGLISAGSITATGLISAGSITATGLVSAGSFSGTAASLSGVMAANSYTGAGDLLTVVSASGITARSLSARAADVINIKDFGGVGDGVTNNTSALNSALAALSGSGGTLFFPAGKYKFLTPVTYTYPAGRFSVLIEGEGADATVLYWPSGAGLSFNTSSSYHSLHLRSLSITTGTTNAGNGVTITNSVQGGAYEQSDFTSVTFRGDDGGGQTDYWTNDISVVGHSNINYFGCLFYGAGSGASAHGNGVTLAGNTSGSFKYSIVHNFVACGFYNHSIGTVYGTYVQGVTFGQCNWTNGATAILAPSGNVSPAQLTVTASQLNCALNSIQIAAGFPGIQIANNLFYAASGGAGIAFTGITAQVSITGNVFSGLGPTAAGNGISISAASQAIISGNSFYLLTNGVFLGSGSSGVTVLGNTYSSNTANVGNTGSGNSIGVAVA